MAEYTLADLEAARAELKRWREAAADDRSNNPHKHHGMINLFHDKVDVIESSLKATGVIPLTEQEKLIQELDRLYPNAQSRSVVERGGKKYQLRYFPLKISNSGKSVTRWGHAWRLLT